ncbi:MAG: PLP-dependent aminotransferase family protein [Pseudomonadota bacterium]
MRLQSPWRPRLANSIASPSDRLVMALADDILEGRLPSGARVPAHRDLAYQLGIGVGTVTKAYAILERRGLVRSVRGRGTFVAVALARRGDSIDLSVNTPPPMLGDHLLALTLGTLSRQIDPAHFTTYPPAVGHDEHRRLLAYWFEGLGMVVRPENLILCSGAQQALNIAFSVAVPPGGTILTEALTYPGAIALARHARYRLTGIAMDDEGMMPGALAQALAARTDRSEPVAVYVTPTMHNPTTATMGYARRVEIARICRHHDVLMIEDDVYALTAAAELPPIAMLAPERTFYVNSLSKTLSPGLRIGGLAVPPGWMDQAETALRATGQMVSPLSCAVMGQWLSDGTASSIRGAIRREAGRRRSVARRILGAAMHLPNHDGFHVWLPMDRQAAHHVAHAAASLGIIVTPPAAVMVDPDGAASGIRLCLGAVMPGILPDALGQIARILTHRKTPLSAHPSV